MFSTLQQVEEFFKKRRVLGMKPGLDRIMTLLNKLDSPQEKIQAIHIAGTNGKGSTLNFMNAALRENNYCTGIFTSPSFQGLAGHILINDEPAAPEIIVRLVNNIYPIIEEMDHANDAPTEFEMLTALAFCVFAENGGIHLIETGMGGRFDTTNSFHPLLSIITTIAHDHTEYLGETIEEIADHKAGIIKMRTPVVLGSMRSEALAVLEEEAEKAAAPCYRFGKEFYLERDAGKTWWVSEEKRHPLHLRMKGEHQLRNAALALKALEELEKKGFTLDWQKVYSALEKAQFPGRFETVSSSPKVIVDAAHNPDGIEALIRTAEKEFPDREIDLVAAMFQDKDTEKMVKQLANHFSSLTLTTFSHPRAWNLSEIRNRWGEDATIVSHAETVFKDIMYEKDIDKIYLITGSLHFIVEARQFFLETIE